MNLDLDVIVERLRGLSALKQVQGAIEFAAIQGTPPKHKQPAAYVIPLASRAGGNTRAGQAVLQEVSESFGVILCLGDQSDAVGLASNRVLLLARRAVRGALLGWSPPAFGDVEFDPIELAPAAGRLLGFRDQVVWWQDSYQTASLISDSDEA